MLMDPGEQQVYDLYDDYCHRRIECRAFFQRAAGVTIGGASALALAESLLPRYAAAQTDKRPFRRTGQAVCYYASVGRCRSGTQADGAPLEADHRFKASLFGPQLLAVTDARLVQVRRETARDPCRPGRPSSRCTLSEIYGCAWL